jgi:murein DD-endopeptidase MepM/ murein hydrolase activator NlpD
MALLIPVTGYVKGLPFGPTSHVSEPAGYAQLQRFWWNAYSTFRFYLHYHPGLDMGAKEGTPILASETGIISALGWNGASGLRYNIRIRPGTIYVGGHLSGIAKNPATGAQWAVGQKIKRGQTIGFVGHSGVASGSHLHFGVQSRVPNTTQNMIYDPLLFFPGGANASDPRILPYY